jgi:hypothetical protein
MKLLRYGPAGQEKPGALDAWGNVRDLSVLIEDIGGDTLLPLNLSAPSPTGPGESAAGGPAHRSVICAWGRVLPGRQMYLYRPELRRSRRRVRPWRCRLSRWCSTNGQVH